MLIDILLLISGFILLVLGGNWLLKSSVDMASKLGMPKMIIGLTIVSFATSAPELIVSLNAALTGSAGISLGNVVGSNIANIGLVLAITVLITPIRIPRNFFKSDWIFLMASTILIMIFISLNAFLSRWEGIVMVLFLVFFILFLIKSSKTLNLGEAHKIDEEKWTMILFYLFIGGGALWLGSELLVRSAKSIAQSFEVPESVIGLTVVAIGTSIPELAASVIAAIKGEKSISLGNLIGSNIFNILSVLGITAIIQPFAVEDTRFLTNDIWWMLAFATIILPFSFIGKKMYLGRIAGIIMLSAYIIYIYLAF